MTLNTEERNALVIYRINKAHTTLKEAEGNIRMGFWNTAANRLYYSCYYAAVALLIKNGLNPHTHSGIVHLLGQHFVNTGLIPKKTMKIYSKLLDLRQDGDYGDLYDLDEEDVKPYLTAASDFIRQIESLIND